MRAAILVVLVVTLLVGGYIWQNKDSKAPTQEEETQNQIYENTDYGVSLTYPDSYVLEERELGTGERWHHNITIMDREAAANILQNGEGPPSITIDIVQNDLDGLSVSDWINNDSRSNFKLLLDGTHTSAIVAGKEATRYAWDGLYRGESVVFEHKGNIIMASVSSFEPTDKIYADFGGILSSFQLK